MGVRFYVSTANAPFFVDNVMGYGDSIPVTGDYKVGDFIISSTQADGIFGWVCTKAGTPGTWEIIGSGKSGGGEDAPITLTGFSNVVEFDDVRNTIAIGIPEYNVETDFLEVHYNGLLLAEGVHYRVDSSNKSIVKLEGNWNPGNYPDQQMIFKVIRGEQGNGKLVQIRKTVDLNVPTTEVITGISEYVPGSDIMEVHLNGVLLMESIDYRYASGKIIKLDTSNPWNPHSVQGQKMYIRVIKNKGNLVPGGGEILDNSIGIEKLSPDLVAKINNHKDPRVGELNNLQTTIKTDVVAAINEIKGKADEAFQSGNNAKQGLVDALVAKGIEASTSESWDSLNNKVKSMKKYNFPNWYTGRDSWINAKVMPIKKSEFGICSFGKYIYCVGGYTTGSSTGNCVCYNTETNEWVDKADIPSKRNGLSTSLVDGKIYAFGSVTSSSNKLNECYDILSNTWTTKASLPRSKQYPTTATVNTNIYIIGGNSSGNYVECYDTITDSYTTKKNIITERKHLVSEVVGDFIYVIGGTTGSDSKKNECYDTLNDSWTSKVDMPTARFGLCSGLVDGKIYAIGGRVGSSSVGNNECYDPMLDSWKRVLDLPTMRNSLRAVAIDSIIYTIGGIAGNYTDVNEIYIP